VAEEYPVGPRNYDAIKNKVAFFICEPLILRELQNSRLQGVFTKMSKATSVFGFWSRHEEKNRQLSAIRMLTKSESHSIIDKYVD
jgi:hypothetical protein